MDNQLRIEYNGTTLYDGDVGEVTWTATEDGISVQARAKGAAPQPKPRPTAAGGGGAGILGKLVESMATAKPRPGRQAVPVQQPAEPVVSPDDDDTASEETFDLAEAP